MRKNSEVSQEQFTLLYREWLESKNVFDLFTAKQVRIYDKAQLIYVKSISQHLTTNSINTALEMLNQLYNHLYLNKKGNHTQYNHIEEIQAIFSYLDTEGVIHLRPSQLFFLTGAILICQHYSVPLHYDTYKVHFRQMNKEMCEIDGLVSLRWFKNYLLGHTHKNIILKHLMNILKQIQKMITLKNKISKGLPNIIEEALVRWKGSSRFTGLFESKKKKIQIYKRIFDQNQSIFFNGNQSSLSQSYFIKKYGEQCIKILQIDSSLLHQYQIIINELLNDYVSVIVKVSLTYQRKNMKNNGENGGSALHIYSSPVSHLHNNNNGKKKVTEYTNKQTIKLQIKTSMKQKTPTKHKDRHKDSDRDSNRKHRDRHKNSDRKHRKHNKTPTPKNRTSPLMQRQFCSAQKSVSKYKYVRDTTPTKSYQGGYHSSIYGGNVTQVYRGSKKQGLQKDSFYQKLFFFRNKRVQSYQIVIKRLKAK